MDFVSFLSQVVLACCSCNFILNCFVEANGFVEEPDDHTCVGSREHVARQFVNFRHTWCRLTGCSMVHSSICSCMSRCQNSFSFLFCSVLHSFLFLRTHLLNFLVFHFVNFPGRLDLIFGVLFIVQLFQLSVFRCCWLQCCVPGPPVSTGCNFKFLSVLLVSVSFQFSSSVCQCFPSSVFGLR